MKQFVVVRQNGPLLQNAVRVPQVRQQRQPPRQQKQPGALKHLEMRVARPLVRRLKPKRPRPVRHLLLQRRTFKNALVNRVYPKPPPPLVRVHPLQRFALDPNAAPLLHRKLLKPPPPPPQLVVQPFSRALVQLKRKVHHEQQRQFRVVGLQPLAPKPAVPPPLNQKSDGVLNPLPKRRPQQQI